MLVNLTAPRYDPISKDEEHRLFSLYFETKDSKIREEILRRNYRFVMYVVRKYVKNADDLSDYFSEGCIGLMTAFNKFTLDRNVKFISYAVFWIKQKIFNRYNYDKNPEDVILFSMDSTLDNEEGLEIEQSTYENQESEYRKTEIKKLLDDRLAELSRFEENIIRLHHINEISYEDIANRYNMNRDKIRLTSTRAVNKIGNSIIGKYFLSKEL